MATAPATRPIRIGEIWATQDGQLFHLVAEREKDSFPLLAIEVKPGLPYDPVEPRHQAWYDYRGRWSNAAETKIDLVRYVATKKIVRRRLA